MTYSNEEIQLIGKHINEIILPYLSSNWINIMSDNYIDNVNIYKLKLLINDKFLTQTLNEINNHTEIKQVNHLNFSNQELLNLYYDSLTTFIIKSVRFQKGNLTNQRIPFWEISIT